MKNNTIYRVKQESINTIYCAVYTLLISTKQKNRPKRAVFSCFSAYFLLKLLFLPVYYPVLYCIIFQSVTKIRY